MLPGVYIGKVSCRRAAAARVGVGRNIRWRPPLARGEETYITHLIVSYGPAIPPRPPRQGHCGKGTAEGFLAASEAT